MLDVAESPDSADSRASGRQSGLRLPARPTLIARLRSIAITFGAALLIGLVHDLLTPIQSLTSYNDMTPFVLAAVALLVISRRRVMAASREET